MGRSKSYDNEEIIYLIEAWGAFQIEQEARKLMCNREMSTIISNNLVSRGFDKKDPSALEDKISRIKSRYLKVRLSYLNKLIIVYQ